ncbi:MAG: DUF3021 domain-containing protein [Lachnospiraceae bacterium]|nr:DUF3021 domain-containing protein [Lachnospiraceae bacterium]
MQYMIVRKIKEIFLTFCMITTGIVVATLIYVKIYYAMNDLDANILWQILFTSFLCSLGNLIHPVREVGKRRFKIDLLLHYLYINVVVLGMGNFFEWFDLSIPSMTLGMAILIIVIFIVISAIIWTMEKRESRRMNEKLLEYQSRKVKMNDADKIF